MLEQLLGLVQNFTQESVVKNSGIPNEHNEGIQNEIMNSITGGLSSAVSGGNLDRIMDLFSKGGTGSSISDNPIVGGITKSVVENLSEKFGISPTVAKNIAAGSIPLIISHFSKKVADPDDSSVDMNSVIGSLTNGGGSGVDFNDILSKFTSGNGGSLDLSSIAGNLLSGSGSSSKSGGGLLGALSGLFK